MIRHYPVFNGDVVQGDAGSSYDLVVTGLPIDPSEATITFEMVHAESRLILLDATAEALSVATDSGEWSCTLRYTWGSGDTATPGTYDVRFIISSTGLSLSIPTIVSQRLRVIPRGEVPSGSG